MVESTFAAYRKALPVAPTYDFEIMPLDQICQMIGVLQYTLLLAPRGSIRSTVIESLLFKERNEISMALHDAAQKVEIARIKGITLKKLLLQMRIDLENMFSRHPRVTSPDNPMSTLSSGVRV